MVNWTSDQLKAIVQKDSDILVSAAAGSGKTAVLVERIIRKLLDKENPMDIDRMLVVTFTEAAASEMKEKIIKALKADGSARAVMQLKLMGNANITTIDAFCLKCVRNNFHRIGVDPEFGICDKAEAELMKEEVCEDLFDELYKIEDAEEKARFLRMTDMFSSNRNDYSLQELILYVYRFVQSFAEPDKWLFEKAAMYDMSADELFESVWIVEVLEKCKKTATDFLDKFSKQLKKMAEAFGDTSSASELIIRYPYYDKGNKEQVAHTMYEVWGSQWNAVLLAISAAQRLKSLFDEKCDNKTQWDKVYGAYTQLTGAQYFPDVRIAGSARENELWYEYNETRKVLNAEFNSGLSCFVPKSSDEIAMQFSELKVSVSDIVWLVRKFSEKYATLKEKKGIYEFSDIEHMTYDLFQKEDVCAEYRDKFDEILIDEYQDTNGLQDSIFRSISKDNIFMVGDLKQSIYRFRGGDPSIFKEKSARDSKSEGGVRIPLSQNFRSRMEILNSVNSVFEAAMSDRVGDVVYEKDECLNRENDYYTENGSDHTSELHIVPVYKSTADDEDMTTEQAEAAYVAKQIKKLIDEKYQVMCGTDEDGKPKYRDIEPRDITILANSVKYIGEIYAKELSEYGISALAENETYFDRKEIMLMLSLLRVINNFRQDIPLIAVMRSVIGGFSDDELARVRYANRDTDNFYDAVCMYETSDDKLTRKCRDFIAKLQEWRGYMKYKSVAGLLWALYEDTGLYDFMGALEGGDEAQANLRLLYERAKSYEDGGFKGVFNFIKYLERLENRAEDISSAKIIGENHNVVRIMTVHKSKGLEFSVVFLVSTGKQLGKGKKDGVGFLNLHKDAGFGIEYVNPSKRYYCETLPYRRIKRINAEEAQSENLRKLYVALTRAKEKMFVICAKRFAKEEGFIKQLNKWEEAYQEGEMSEEYSVNANGFADWIVPVAMGDNKNWKVTVAEKVYADSESVADILSYEYPYKGCCHLPSKTTVSEIKMRDADESGYSFEYAMSKRPRFIENTTQANVVGKAHHQVMAYINPKADMSREYVLSEIERICAMGEITDADKETISIDFIQGFFENELGMRMIEADKNGRLHRESPFEISVKANVYEPSLYGNALYDEDEIIVQGAIDCYFEEDDGIVLIDYKTDKFRGDLSNEEEVQSFINKKIYDYTVQIELYTEAIQSITKKNVKEKYLYLFSVSRMVKL